MCLGETVPGDLGRGCVSIGERSDSEPIGHTWWTKQERLPLLDGSITGQQRTLGRPQPSTLSVTGSEDTRVPTLYTHNVGVALISSSTSEVTPGRESTEPRYRTVRESRGCQRTVSGLTGDRSRSIRGGGVVK